MGFPLTSRSMTLDGLILL